MAIGMDAATYFLECPEELCKNDMVENVAGIEVQSIDEDMHGFEITRWDVLHVMGDIHYLSCSIDVFSQQYNIGDVLVIKNSEFSKKECKLALLRRVQQTESDVNIVIEYLPKTETSIQMSPKGTDSNESFDGFYILADKIKSTPAAILLENIAITENNQYEVILEGQHYIIMLSKLIKETMLFSLCSFKVLQQG